MWLANASELGKEIMMPVSARPGKLRGAGNRIGKHLHVSLTDSALLELNTLSEATGKSSTELIRFGLGLVKVWVKASKEGNRMILANRDGRALKQIPPLGHIS